MNNYETPMDEKTLKEVLAELLVEMQGIRKFMEAEQTIIGKRGDTISQLVNGFEAKFKNIQVSAPSPDLSLLIDVLDKAFVLIQQKIELGPKPVKREFRFLLFPETNTDHYYKLIFGKMLPWLVIITVATFLFSLGSQWISGNQALEQQRIETNISAKAWDNLYQKAGVKDKKALDRFWEKSVKAVKQRY